MTFSSLRVKQEALIIKRVHYNLRVKMLRDCLLVGRNVHRIAVRYRIMKSRQEFTYTSNGIMPHWSRGLRRRSVAVRLLRLWVRTPLGGIDVHLLRVLCLVRPEESYRLWCVVVCDLETSQMRRPWPTGGLLCQKQTME